MVLKSSENYALSGLDILSVVYDGENNGLVWIKHEWVVCEVVTKAVVSPIISKHNWPPIVAMDNITGHSDSPYWFSS